MSTYALLSVILTSGIEDYLKVRNDPLKAIKKSLDLCVRDRNGSFLNLDRKGAIAAARLSQKRY